VSQTSLSQPFGRQTQQTLAKIPRYKHRQEENETLRSILLIAIASVLMAPATVYCQTRRRTNSARPSNTNSSIADARSAGATRVADQVKNLTKFLYLYGGIGKDLQAVDAAVQRGEASQTAIDKANQSKSTIKSSLANVRDGLDKLEVDFRTTPALQPYYIKLAGAAAGAADATQLAESGQYDSSGRALLVVVNRLTDVLVAIRQ
jgi:hypothetical protein